MAWNANFIEDKFQLLKQCARQQLAEDFGITEMKKLMKCFNPYNILKESIFHLVPRLRGGLRIFSIDVEAADTIDNVKDKIQDKEAPRPISSV